MIERISRWKESQGSAIKAKFFSARPSGVCAWSSLLCLSCGIGSTFVCWMDVGFVSERWCRRMGGKSTVHCGKNTPGVFHIPPNLKPAVKRYQTQYGTFCVTFQQRLKRRGIMHTQVIGPSCVTHLTSFLQ